MKNYLFLSLCLLVYVLTSCKKIHSDAANNQITLPAVIPGQPLSLDSIPLHTGNSWVYKMTSQTTTYTYNTTFSNTPPDSSLSNPAFGDITFEATGNTVVNGFSLACIKATSTGSLFFAPNTDTGYYSNLGDGLHRLSNLTTVDSSTINNIENLILKLPVVLNTPWGDSKVNAQWLGYFKVTTPAGTFNCVKLETTIYEQDDRLYITQYYSSKGLVAEMNRSLPNATPPGIFAGFTNMLILQSTNF